MTEDVRGCGCMECELELSSEVREVPREPFELIPEGEVGVSGAGEREENSRRREQHVQRL